MSFTKTSKMAPSKALPNSRKFYHWPSAIGIRETTSVEDLSAEILSSVRSALDRHSSVVSDEIFTLREVTREFKDTVNSLKEDNTELNKKCRFLLDENMYLNKEILGMKTELEFVKKHCIGENTSTLCTPGPSGDKYTKVSEIIELEIEEEDVEGEESPISESKRRDKAFAKAKFTTRSAKTDWFWTAAKEKKCGNGTKASTSEDPQNFGKTIMIRQRKSGKEKRMPFAWANSCRLVGENTTDKGSDVTWWEDVNPVEDVRLNNVYCKGVLLHDVQLARLYSDSKTFVDMKLKYPENEVIAKYEALREQYGGKTPPTEKIQEFVDNNFEQGDELEEWTPTDFKTKPSLVDRVSDPLFKAWVEDLNYIFLNLSRKVKPDVKTNQDLYSLLYVPNGFFIPGGRFRELYYWDTYWILNGVLLCDMATTARGIIENLLYLVQTYNLIPNGSRKYYLQRSQPPLLIPMMNQYYSHTKDLEFVKQNIALLEKEFNFWMTNRMVRLKKNNICYKLARYYSPSSGPRPESYREDYLTAENLPTEEKKKELYISLKSAAESGLDFSTRWFIKNGTNAGNLSNIDAPHIIPVDLNAFLERNARLLSKFHKALGNPDKAAHYEYRAKKLLQAMEAILWNNEQGIWLDYDLVNLKPRDYFYMSNFAPLWTRSYSFPREILSRRVLEYLAESKVDEYIGGVPTSLNASGEQWDFPNAWPPLQAILIQGLANLDTVSAKETARHYALKWLRSNYKGYDVFHKMFEKYDVTLLGQTGTGGEYEFQTGFGWTNGVVLELLNTYGHEASVNDKYSSNDTKYSS